jgi:Restriction Endonuclease associating with ARP
MMQQIHQKSSSGAKEFRDDQSVSTKFTGDVVGDQPLPFGTEDLDSGVQIDRHPPLRVRCYHRGCGHWVRRPTRYYPGEPCPEHGIRCHYSEKYGPTYSYAEPRRNIIVADDLFGKQIIGHPFKHETDRFGYEKSEDALTWNVMRSLQEVGVLREVAAWLTGFKVPDVPRLYLWGLRIDDDSCAPWELLIKARERFERELPVDRPFTEPDIALHLPGRYLVLIEAKFTSPNTFYVNGPRRSKESLTKKELIEIYQDQNLRILNVVKARSSARVYNQLWRNMVFAEWMASLDGDQTQAYLVNLTRLGYEQQGCAEFHDLVRPGFANRFVHRTWEEIDDLLASQCRKLARLHHYLAMKTTGLLPAFRLGHFGERHIVRPACD